MDFNYLFLFILIPALVHILLLNFLVKCGKYPSILPRSENPRKEYIEAVIYTLIVILYLAINIFVLYGFSDSFYIALGFSTVIFLLIPLIYVLYRDHWTSKDLGISYKVKSRWVVIASIIIYTYFGFTNTLTAEISWYLLLIYFYSNAFLEEFLFRGVIQSKLERAIGQKKAIIFQALLFMSIHIPVNSFHFFLDSDFIRLFSAFGFQLINGIIFGMIFLKTRNIWISVICHYLSNWFGAIITLFL